MYILYTNQFKNGSRYLTHAYGTHYFTTGCGFYDDIDFARIFNSRKEASDVAKKFKLYGWHIIKLIPPF
jgi:hypothetical protein